VRPKKIRGLTIITQFKKNKEVRDLTTSEIEIWIALNTLLDEIYLEEETLKN
jgi:hypothetical protein